MTTQTTSTHTPGPWTIEVTDEDDRLSGWAYIITEMEDEYAAANASDDDDLMDAANARNAANIALIAAAPALLAALEALVADCVANPGEDEYAREPGFYYIEQARAAIRLARGGG